MSYIILVSIAGIVIAFFMLTIVAAIYMMYLSIKILAEALIKKEVCEKLEGNDAMRFATEDIASSTKISKVINKQEENEIQKMIKEKRLEDSKKKEAEENEWIPGISQI